MAREIASLLHVTGSAWVVLHGIEVLAQLRIERVKE